MYDPGTLFPNESDHQNLSYSTMNFLENRDISQKHEDSYSNWYNHHQESDNSGAATPPLWKNSPSPSRPLLGRHDYGSLSQNSRTEAIVRGRWELMEMVKKMPESSYELSLKDMVELNSVETQSPRREIESLDKNRSLHQRVKVKREDESRKIDRNLSFENKGMFLNMVFPFSIKSKKKNKFVSNNSVKVSPKGEGLKNGGERDWWKKTFRGSSDSDSSRTSDNSGTSGSSTTSGSSGGGGGSSGGDNTVRRKRKGLLCACWPAFHLRGNKSAE